MPTNYTALTNGQFATAAVFNAPLTELDNAIQAIVGGTKTLTTPTISSFANATHAHQNAAGGGTLDAAALASGTLDNARINWAAPSAIGGTTPAAGTFTVVTVSRTTANAIVNVQANAGQARGVQINTGSSARWLIYGSSGAESGSNAGTDFAIARHTDAGSFVSNSLVIERATGNTQFSGNVAFNGATVPTRPTYGASTGTATRTTFDTTTITTAQLAERVKAMIDDFRARGDFA